MLAANVVANGDDTPAAEELAQRQARYTKNVTAATRIAGRRGLRSKPKSSVEVQLLILDAMTAQNHILQGAVDSYRAVVGTFVCATFRLPY